MSNAKILFKFLNRDIYTTYRTNRQQIQKNTTYRKMYKQKRYTQNKGKLTKNDLIKQLVEVLRKKSWRKKIFHSRDGGT